ncbi:hypothetical protein CIB48_g3097 [Xylaria polymorpha]|nr:hypothetical protein CIB48_g3097 [Xylaria polymorpha]
MATIAAGIAATAAGLTYLDGKYHIRQDLKMIRAKSKGAKMFQKAIQEQRISPYYFFEKYAQAHPNEECIWWRPGSCTWGAAYARANQFAHFFLSQGVAPGDLVAFFMGNSPDFVLAWMGLWAIGAAPALINYNLTRQALLHCLGIAGSKLVLADGPDGILERLEAVAGDLDASGVRVVKLAEVGGQIAASPATRPPDELRASVTPNSPFGLFYTSGTTGLPKACTVPAAAGFTHGVSRECGFAYVTPTSDDGHPERYYDCMPLYHGTGGISGMTQLITGQTLCLAPKFSASRFWDDVRASRATWFVYVGETLRYLLAAAPSPLDKQHSVRAIYGNGLRPDVWVPFRERFGIETIHEFFNSTEGIMPLDNPARGRLPGAQRGPPRAHRQVAVSVRLRARGHRPGDGGHRAGRQDRVREAHAIRGRGRDPRPPAPDHHARVPGYYGNEDATAKKYVRDVFRKGDCYYRTGDALRRDADGRWFFLDRLGDTFRWKGENVSTAEVSEVLGRYPGVSEATVYGISLPGHDGKAGMAAVYINSEASSFDYGGLLKHARAHLPKYAVPIFLRQLSARSATHNNKQDKVPLKKTGIDPAQMDGELLFWISDNGKGDDTLQST